MATELSTRRMPRFIILVVLIFAAAFGGFAYWYWKPLVDRLPAEITRQEYDLTAQELKTSQRKSEFHDVLFTLGLDKTQSDAKKAVVCFNRIPSSHPRLGHLARYHQGRALAYASRVGEGEQQLSEFLQLEAEAPQAQAESQKFARLLLLHLFTVQLRFKERQQLLHGMYERDELDLKSTLLCWFPNVNRWNVAANAEKLEEWSEADPNNYRVQVALGRYRTGQGRLDEARNLLEQCLLERPGELNATAALLECLHEMVDWKAVASLHDKLPAMATSEPYLMLRMRGRWYLRQKQFEQAIDCYQAVLKPMPTNGESYQGLAKAYGGLERSEQETESLYKKASVLNRIQNRVYGLLHDPEATKILEEIAELCQQIDLDKHATVVLGLRHQDKGGVLNR